MQFECSTNNKKKCEIYKIQTNYHTYSSCKISCKTEITDNNSSNNDQMLSRATEEKVTPDQKNKESKYGKESFIDKDKESYKRILFPQDN